MADFSERAPNPRKLLVLFKERLRPGGGSVIDVPALPVSQRVGQCLHRLMNNAVCLAFVHLERTHLVHQFVDDVSEIEGVKHSHTEVDGKLQTWLAARRLDAI